MKFTYLVALFAFTLIIGTLGFSVKEGAIAKRNAGQNMFTGGGVAQNMNASSQVSSGHVRLGQGKKISNK